MTNVSPAMSGGTLAGTGRATLLARRYLAPVPVAAPDALRGRLAPIHDEDGELLDWQLNPDLSGTAAVMAAADLAAWRAGWVHDEPLCLRATVAEFLTWACGHADAGPLRMLLSEETVHGGLRVDPASAAGLARHAEQVGAALRVADERGVGLAAPGRAGLLRGFAASIEPADVLRRGDTAVTVTGTRLLLHVPDLGGAGPSGPITLRGWVRRGGRTVVLTGAGDGRLGEHDVTGTDAAEMLGVLAPDAARVSVLASPLTAVFAPLTVVLPRAARAAAAAAATLHLVASVR